MLPRSLLRGAGALAQGAVLRLLAKTVAVTLAIFVVFGGGLMLLVYPWVVSLGLEFGVEFGLLATFVLAVVASWLLFRIVALAVLQFFADEVVVAVERRWYPDAAAAARRLGTAEEARLALAGAGRAILANLAAAPIAIVLLFTGVGPALVFWAVNAWLLGRELTDMVWLRHRPGPEAPTPVGRGERFLLGGAIAALLAIPFANLLAPVLGAAAATHLVHGRLRRNHAA